MVVGMRSSELMSILREEFNQEPLKKWLMRNALSADEVDDLVVKIADQQLYCHLTAN